MQKFESQAAQGDVLIRRIDKLPEGVSKANAEGGKHIVGHSETGHHHTVAAHGIEMFRGSDPMVMFLNVREETPMIHERSFDTHEALSIEPGVYEVRNQREYTPEGFKRVVD